MDILQVNIVQQILVLLEGLLPSLQDDDEEEKPSKKPYGSANPVLRKRPGVAATQDDDTDEDDDEDELDDVNYVDTNKTAHEQIFIFCIIW